MNVGPSAVERKGFVEGAVVVKTGDKNGHWKGRNLQEVKRYGNGYSPSSAGLRMRPLGILKMVTDIAKFVFEKISTNNRSMAGIDRNIEKGK